MRNTDDPETGFEPSAHIELTADIVSAYVSNNPVPVGELPALIEQIYNALKNLGSANTNAIPTPQKPAVPIRRSVTADYIICLEDGKEFKSLKRHIATHHGLSPDEYRTKWELPADYPMVAPAYAASRSALAKKMGLGRKPKSEPAPVKIPVKRTRKAKVT